MISHYLTVFGFSNLFEGFASNVQLSLFCSLLTISFASDVTLFGFQSSFGFALALASAEAILSQLRFFVNTFFLFLRKSFLTGSKTFPSHEHER